LLIFRPSSTARLDFATQEIVLSDEIVKLQETDGDADKVDGNGYPGEAIGENKNVTADAVENLRDQSKVKEELLQPRDLALAKFQEAPKAKLAELTSRIEDQERQLRNREIQLQHLASERDFLVIRARELVADRAKARAHQDTDPIETKLTDLRLQLEKREGSLAAREFVLSRQEADLRTSIQNLHLRLQETEARLASRERELKQKDSLIDAAAVRETEMGRFIERLSSECDKLSAELCEQRILITRLQDKTRHSTNGGKVWKKVLGLAQDEAS
jgi:chromosome segregation ATPase